MQAKQIHIVKDLPEDLVAEIYTTEMLQVISNLIVNSLDALPRDGTLLCACGNAAARSIWSLRTMAMEFPQSTLIKCLSRFLRRKKSAQGLGLALSKRIVEHNHGRISLRSSVPPGKSGTTFKISLPA